MILQVISNNDIGLNSSSLLIAIITLFILILLISLLWIYSSVPSLFLDYDLDKLSNYYNKHLFSYSLTKEATEYKDKTATDTIELPKPSIHLPYLRSSNYMNVKPIPETQWIELDTDVLHQLYLCNQIVVTQQRPEIDHIFLISKEYEIQIEKAGYEALDMIIQYLIKYYPGIVTYKIIYDDTIDESAIDKYIIFNHIMNQAWDVSRKRKNEWTLNNGFGSVNTKDNHIPTSINAAHPLLVARYLVGDDLAIMIKNLEGIHILAAGVIFFPDDWHLEDKLDLPLAAIHYPVNALNTKKETIESHTNPSSSALIRAMELLFHKLYQEHNHNKSINNDNNNDLFNDAFTNNNHETQIKYTVYNRFNWAFQSHPYMTNRFKDAFNTIKELLIYIISIIMDKTIYKEFYFRCIIREYFTFFGNIIRKYILGIKPFEIFLRTERQTLRLLPTSETVLFTIRTQVTPISIAIDTIDKAKDLRNALLNDVLPTDNRARAEYKTELLHWLYQKFHI